MLGNAAAGSGSAGTNSTIVDTHLRNAQTLLYWTHDWAHLRGYDTDTLGQHQYQIDYPEDANPDRIKAISVYRGGVWSKPLEKGIPPSMFTYMDNYTWPQRWEPYEQIEFQSKADQAYDIRVFFIKAMDRLTQDGDRFVIDDTLVSIVAIGTLKAHYRQPDAKVHMDASDVLVRKLKTKSWGQDVFRPNDYANVEPLVRPQTV